MQNFVLSISQLGVPIQWSTDITEHAYISKIKIPARASNNNNYDPQICWYLDRAEKCWTFKLAISMHKQELSHPSQGWVEDNKSNAEDNLGNDKTNKPVMVPP